MHRRVFAGSNLHVARNTAYQTHPRPIEKEECPLCRVVLGKPRRAFVKHIARHMEEIALMALPRSSEEDSESSSTITGQSNPISGSVYSLAAESESVAREETSYNQTGKLSTNNITDQQGVPSYGIEAARLERDRILTTGNEAALDATLAPSAEAKEDRPKPTSSKESLALQQKTGQAARHKGASQKNEKPGPRHWICGHCHEGGMLIIFDRYCVGPTCGRLRDLYATEY